MKKLSEQVEELRAAQEATTSAIEAEKAEVSGKLDEMNANMQALEARIVELGEVDPDLQALIDKQNQLTTSVQEIVATPVAEPTPVEEAPSEEAPTEAPVEAPAEPAPAEGEPTGGDVLNPEPVVEAPAEAPAEGGDTGTGEESPVEPAPAETEVPAGEGSDAGTETTEAPVESPADGGETFPADTTGGTAGEGTDTATDAGTDGEPRA